MQIKRSGRDDGLVSRAGTVWYGHPPPSHFELFLRMAAESLHGGSTRAVGWTNMAVGAVSTLLNHVPGPLHYNYTFIFTVGLVVL